VDNGGAAVGESEDSEFFTDGGLAEGVQHVHIPLKWDKNEFDSKSLLLVMLVAGTFTIYWLFLIKLYVFLFSDIYNFAVDNTVKQILDEFAESHN